MSLNLLSDHRLDTVPSTNYRIVVTVRLIVVVVVVAMGTYIYEVIRHHESMAINILDSTYLALIVLAGVNAAQYATKRFSDKGYKAAGQAPQVITSEGGPITAAPGGTLQKQENESAPEETRPHA